MLSAHGQAVLWRQCEAGGWWAGGWWAQGRRTVGSAGLAWVGAVSRCLVPFGVVQKRTPCDHPAMAPMGGLLSFFLPAAVRPHPCTGAAVSSTGLDNRRGICRGRVAVGLHAGLTGAQPVIQKARSERRSACHLATSGSSGYFARHRRDTDHASSSGMNREIGEPRDRVVSAF